MNKKLSPILITAIAVIVLLLAVALFFNEKNLTAPEQNRVSPTSTPTPTQKIEKPSGWETFKSENLGFTISHPDDVRVIERTDNSTSLILFGPTQTEGTEVFDGVILTFRTGSLNNNLLKEFVDNKVEEIEKDEVSQIVETVKPITVAGNSGFTFIVSGLGEFRYIYLPKGDNQYLEIAELVEDPTNQGFRTTTDQILSTLEIK